MLKKSTKELLQGSKNLLAFSAGVDSTALFFLLREAGVAFDIAIVDYGLREQSKEEVAYAKELAQRYKLTCHTLKAPKITQNFEANARKIRYEFFDSLIEKHHYQTLLTAHHLGDRLEWFLMQFCKGAGCVELSGMREIELREHYRLVHPLLEHDKAELLEYLRKNGIKYFIDQKNSHAKNTRNHFRKAFAEPLLQEYKAGIAKSFAYIERDQELLIEEVAYQSCNELSCFQSSSWRSDIYHIDKILKSRGHIITAQERAQLKEQESLVVGRKYIIAKVGDFICIAPYIEARAMDKTFKEQMRKLRVDPKLRGYLASDSEAVAFLSLLLA
jgi:tRNA(Ile)-lysidine synthase